MDDNNKKDKKRSDVFGPQWHARTKQWSARHKQAQSELCSIEYIMNRYVIIYLNFLFIPLFLILGAGIADDNPKVLSDCTFGGEQQYYQSGNPSGIKCDDTPEFLNVWVPLWFFFGYLPIWPMMMSHGSRTSEVLEDPP
tara:strand:+ start:708 stop:1124 length:417 start_codon:yes stop_codon:yes gene_type:complete